MRHALRDAGAFTVVLYSTTNYHSPFTMTSRTSRIWVVVFSRDLWDFGGRFLIDTTSSDELVADLKTLVKNRRQEDLSRVDAPDLTVWRC
jgi:hypothetical protein